MDDFYELLGVSESASQDELKQAYREKVREYHPDVNPDETSRELFKLLNRAYEVLSDSAERKDYDRLGHVAYVRHRLDGYDLADVDEILETDHTGGSRDRRTSAESVRTNQSGSGSPSSGASSNSTQRSSPGRNSSPSSRRDRATGTTGNESGSRSADAATGRRSTTTSTGKASDSTTTRGSGSTSSTSTRSRDPETGRGIGRSGPTADRTSNQPEEHKTNGSGSGLADAVDPSNIKRTRGSRSRSAGLFTLGRAWLSVALSLGVYVAGLAGYVATNRSGVGSLVDAVTVSPSERLMAPLGIEPPLEAAVAGTLATVGGQVSLVTGLLFGAVLLAVSMTATVKKFGSGSARLYAVAGLSPVAGLGLGVVTQTTVVVVVLLVVLPVVGCILFLVDVGRYLGARG